MPRILAFNSSHVDTGQGYRLVERVDGMTVPLVTFTHEKFGGKRPKRGFVRRTHGKVRPGHARAPLVILPDSDKHSSTIFYQGQIQPNGIDRLEVDLARTSLKFADPRLDEPLGDIVGGADPRVGLGLALLLCVGDRLVTKPLGDGRIWVVANKGGEFVRRPMTLEAYCLLFPDLRTRVGGEEDDGRGNRLDRNVSRPAAPGFGLPGVHLDLEHIRVEELLGNH